MAGLTARDGAQFRALIELRRRLSFRRFKGRPQEAAVTIVFLLLALPLPFLIAFLTGHLYARLPHPWDAELLGVVATVLWMLWLFAPVFGASMNESPDLDRLLVLPVRRRVLIASAFAGSVFDYSTLLSVPFLAAAWISWVGGGSPWIPTVALLVTWAHLLVIGQLVSTVGSGLTRSRRFRDFATVAGSILGLAVFVIQIRSHGLGNGVRGVAERMRDADLHPLDVLQWTPPGACVRAIERASAGETGAAALWLLGSLLMLVVLVLAWWRALDHITTHGEFSFGGRRSRRHERASSRDQLSRRIPGVPASVLVVAQTDVRLAWRTPRRRMQMMQGLLMPLVFGAVWLRGASASETITAFVPAMFVSLMGSFWYQNVVAQDGRGVAVIFLSPLDRAAWFRGKVLAFAAMSVVPIVAMCVFAAWSLPALPAAVATLMALSAFAISSAVSTGFSARFVVRLPEDDRRAKPSGQSVAGWMLSLVQPLLFSVLFGPVWIPVLVGMLAHRPAVALIAALAGVAYGWILFRVAMRNAGQVLVRNEPEMFHTLELGRTS